MSFLWRISLHANLAGIGGEMSSGRWHTAAPGKRIVYLAEHPALAIIETFVNINGNLKSFPKAFQLLKVEIPTAAEYETTVDALLPPGWQYDLALTRRLGDAWLADGLALMRVPSAPCPESFNYLLNPSHRDASQIAIVEGKVYNYDPRLFGIRPIQ